MGNGKLLFSKQDSVHNPLRNNSAMCSVQLKWIQQSDILINKAETNGPGINCRK